MNKSHFDKDGNWKYRPVVPIMIAVVLLAQFVISGLERFFPADLLTPKGFDTLYTTIGYAFTLAGFYYCLRKYSTPGLDKFLLLSTFKQLFDMVAVQVFMLFAGLMVIAGIALAFNIRAMDPEPFLLRPVKLLCAAYTLLFLYRVYRYTRQYLINVQLRRAGKINIDAVKPSPPPFIIPKSFRKVFLAAFSSIVVAATFTKAVVFYITHNYSTDLFPFKEDGNLFTISSMTIFWISFYFFYQNLGWYKKDPSFYKNLPIWNFRELWFFWAIMIAMFSIVGALAGIFVFLAEFQVPYITETLSEFISLIAFMFMVYLFYFTVRCSIHYLINKQARKAKIFK